MATDERGSHIEISGVAEALSNIIHGGETRGTNLTEFRRQKRIVHHNGAARIEMVPIVSGNSIRGQLRDDCAEFNLQAAGINQVKDVKTYHLLFNAGALEKVGGESYINLAEERKLRRLFPAVSLFGGSIGNRILGGLIVVNEWTPIARELTASLPDEYRDEAQQVSVYDLLDTVFFTRRDDVNNRRLVRYLDAETAEIYRQGKTAKQEANEAEEKGESAQMYYEYECLVPGTRFYVKFLLHDVDDVHLGTFLAGLASFATRGIVGGRGSTGMGRVRLDLKQIAVGQPTRVVGEIASGKIEAARAHLDAHREEVAQVLEGLV